MGCTPASPPAPRGAACRILPSICNLPLVFLRILSSAQFFSERLQEVPSFLETCRLVRWDLPRENSVRAEICSPRPEIFCCKLTLSLISPRDFLGSAPVFLRQCAFCRALLEMSRLAICSLLISPRPVLKTAPLRFHEGLVSPGAPLGSPNWILMTGRILCERSEVGVAICSGEFGISAGPSEFCFSSS